MPRARRPKNTRKRPKTVPSRPGARPQTCNFSPFGSNFSVVWHAFGSECQLLLCAPAAKMELILGSREKLRCTCDETLRLKLPWPVASPPVIYAAADWTGGECPVGKAADLLL